MLKMNQLGVFQTAIFRNESKIIVDLLQNRNYATVHYNITCKYVCLIKGFLNKYNYLGINNTVYSMQYESK